MLQRTQHEPQNPLCSEKHDFKGRIAMSAVAKEPEGKIIVKTDEACRCLSCDKKTLWHWRKRCPGLFAPVKYQKRGNLYFLRQIKLMAFVMSGLMEPKEGVELWERTKAANIADFYRDAGDKTRAKGSANAHATSF
jgi:hypothetical protein